MDLNMSLSRAHEAARRGDIDVLEMELAVLGKNPVTNKPGMEKRLRAIANAVRCHPSFTQHARAQAV